MTLPAHHPDTVPPRDDIAAHLIAVHRMPALKAHIWSATLVGLPWRYIRPVAVIAVNTRQPRPNDALIIAADRSDDQAFKEAVREHTKHWEARE